MKKQMRRMIFALLLAGAIWIGFTESVQAVLQTTSKEGAETNEEMEEPEEILDNIVPELTRFEILSNGGALVKEDGICYAENLKDKEDLQILVSIKEQEENFDRNAVVLEVSKDGSVWEKLKSDEGEIWEDTEGQYSTSYDFDGEECGEASYQFRISYTNNADEEMVLSKTLSAVITETEKGFFQFPEKVVIDHENPRLTGLDLGTPVQMYEDETAVSNGTVTDIIKDAQTRLYYDQNRRVEFSVEDSSLTIDDFQITLFVRENKTEEWAAITDYDGITKTKIDDTISCEIVFPSKDQEDYFMLSCTDRSGNVLNYQSPVLIQDTMAPDCEIVREQGTDQYNCVEESKIILNCFETNLDLEQSYIEVEAKDIYGNILSYAKTPLQEYDQFLNHQTVILSLTGEGNYEIQISFMDKVKQAETYQKSFCIDRTSPTITVVTTEGKSFTNLVNEHSGLFDPEQSDLTYSVSDGSEFSTIIDKLSFGYFSDKTIIAQIKVHDEISGVAGMYFSSIPQDGEETASYFSKSETIEENAGVIQYDIELPKNFKGTVKARGIDKTGNMGEDTGAIGVISETEEKHQEVSGVQMEILSNYSKTPNYYSGDIDVKFQVFDGHSGVYSADYLAGNYQETVRYPSKEEICLEQIKEYHLSAKENNANNLLFGLGFLDHAGYETKMPKEELPVVHIDTVTPEIEVSYDVQEAENEIYYKKSRIAAITITERNFDPKDTWLEVTGPPVTISGWKHFSGSGCTGGSDPMDTHHTDQCQWVSTIEFSNDGKYTFTCRTTDLAGNTTAYGKTDEFIIDQTRPEVKVSYDQQQAFNSFYYNNRRIASVEINEKNFRASDVVIAITAENQGKEIALPQVSHWSREGDVNRAKIVYEDDGEYTFDISYKDLAGNEAADYQEDYFIIDQTMPEIVIENVEHLSANSGEAAPHILWTDQNFDMDGITVTLSGVRNGVQEWKGKKLAIPNGMEYQMEDFAYVPEADDLYTIYVTVRDLAGNSNEAALLFSVNRFGSVYQFSKDTERLIGETGSYYTKKGQNLTIMETNVDTLEFQEIILNHNGKLRTLENEKDYRILSSGDAESWKQYTYHIYQENFQEEGHYLITIYSEDRAKNRSDNHSKGKKIEFVVDRSAPSILVTGLEKNGQYRSEWKEVLLDIEDNVCMDRIEVLHNGAQKIYSAEEIAANNGRILLVINRQEQWQSLQITAFDKAGNRSQTEKIAFLLTPNLWVQFYGNQPLFWGTLSFLLLILISFYMIIRIKRKKSAAAS